MKNFALKLNNIADNNNNVKKYKDWDEVHSRKVLSISVNDFWNNFWAENASYSADKFSKHIGHFDIQK
jgi:hypothetical protein